LSNLNESVDHVSVANNDRLTETLKYSSSNGHHGNKDSYALASKLEQSMTKVKELKLKNRYMEK
jgi:hypothetical protein